MRVIPTARIEMRANEELRQPGCLRVPIPVELVAHRLGLVVEPAALGEDVSGVLVLSDGGGTIGVNTAHASVRQRFSIAHKLGHYVLHPDAGQLFIDRTYAVDRNSGGQARSGSGGRSPSWSTASCQRSLTAATGSSTVVRSSCSTTKVTNTSATCRTIA